MKRFENLVTDTNEFNNRIATFWWGEDNDKERSSDNYELAITYGLNIKKEELENYIKDIIVKSNVYSIITREIAKTFVADLITEEQFRAIIKNYVLTNIEKYVLEIAHRLGFKTN